MSEEIRLTVQMPTVGTYSIRGRATAGGVEVPVETMVKVLERIEYQGKLSGDMVRALAFVPQQYRRHLAEKRKLVDGEYAWVYARLADNKRSLRAFMDSGEVVWPVVPSKPVAADLSGAALWALVMESDNAGALAMLEAAMRAFLVSEGVAV